MKMKTISSAFLLILALAGHFMIYGQNRNERLDSVVKSLNLKEVVVSAKKIRQNGDTISYSAATYRTKEDKTLSDLLRKMPGIEVNDNGQVMYNGQWIKELYIEGMNMLGDNYGVATNNIDAKSIGTVQVMENHQDVKMLQGLQKGTSPAINIKLKEDAKGVWTSTAEGALGSQPGFSWNLSANLMNFRRRAQNISVYKTDNVGEDLRKEIGAPSTFATTLGVSLLTPGKPSLNNRYSYRNDSHSLSVNQLFRLKENHFLTFNATYLYDKERRETNNVTTYLTDSISHYIFSELNSASMRQHFAGINAAYKINGSKTYLKNSLSANISFPKGRGIIGEEMLQVVKGHSISVNDVFEFRHRKWGGGIGDATIRFTFNDRDGSLGVPDSLLTQRIRQQRVRLNGQASLLSLLIPYLMFNLDFGLDADRQAASSNLDKGGSSDYGKIVTWNVIPSIIPRIVLHHGQNFQWWVNIPLGIRIFNSADGDWKYDKISPYIKLNTTLGYKLNNRWNLAMMATAEEEVPSALSLMSQKYFADYRTVLSNQDHVEMKPDRTYKIALSTDYKNILDMTFGSLSISYSHTKYGTSAGYSVNDGEIEYERLPFSTRSSILNLNQKYSKGFFKGNSKISEELSIGTNTLGYYVGKMLHSGRNDFLKGRLDYTASLKGWLTFSTRNEVTFTKIFTDGKREGKIRTVFSNISSLTVSPIKNLFFRPSVMFYHNNYFDSYRNNVFLNCRMEYTLGEVILSVQADNLLDNKIFRRFSDNGIISRSNEYQLRGRTIMFGVRLRLF
ncbi:MAG: hypothetical protein K2J82_04005 [Muribaculaceae bacterium]|nr:hypothetical protein [Muribaculaceae bacterium]